jgi:hypothetical protein
MLVSQAGTPAEGIVTVTDRPLSSRGRAVAVPPWIAARAMTSSASLICGLMPEDHPLQPAR